MCTYVRNQGVRKLNAVLLSIYAADGSQIKKADLEVRLFIFNI